MYAIIVFLVLLQRHRIRAVLYTRRASAFPIAAYFPGWAHVAALSDAYTLAIAFLSATSANAFSIAAYFAKSAATAGGLNYALTTAIRCATGTNTLAITAYFSIRAGLAGDCLIQTVSFALKRCIIYPSEVHRAS